MINPITMQERVRYLMRDMRERTAQDIVTKLGGDEKAVRRAISELADLHFLDIDNVDGILIYRHEDPKKPKPKVRTPYIKKPKSEHKRSRKEMVPMDVRKSGVLALIQTSPGITTLQLANAASITQNYALFICKKLIDDMKIARDNQKGKKGETRWNVRV